MAKKQFNGSSEEADRPERSDYFSRFARTIAELSGSVWAFMLALAVVIAWAVSGPYFRYSETWQLVINTGTTVITFLMVFIIQHSQNKDTLAIQLKLDELIRATEGAQNAVMDLEDLSHNELKKIYSDYMELASQARSRMDNGNSIETFPAVTGKKDNAMVAAHSQG
jgi:low affinity Fe/Cu permease